jgi:recombination protein RecA
MVDKFEDAVKEVHKRFGKSSLMPLTKSAASDPVPVYSTGCAAIDEITGIGGLPRGRVTEVYGPEGGGKTTLVLQVIAEAQRQGGRVVFIDAEHALDTQYAQALGVDIEKLLISQPDCGEDALEIAGLMIQSGGIALVAVDSVAALVPRNELEGDMGDAQMGAQARLMSQAMRKITGVTSRTGTCAIFINQIREKIGVMFGNNETTTGGRALKFFSSMRVDVRRIGQKKKGDVIIGNKVKVKIVKNKLSAPYRDTEVFLKFGCGFQNEETE